MMPRLISGWPKSAEDAATRTSQAMAISQPPPNASPLTAAMVTIGEFSHSRASAWISSRCARPDSASHSVKALMSAPAQNSAGFADASTIARARPCSSSQAVRSAAIVAGASEFAGGFCSHTTATRPRRSSLTIASS